MEAIAQLQLAQDYEISELHESNGASWDGMKLSTKTVATAFGVTGAALMVGALAEAPALAYHYGCCRPVVYQPIVYQPIVYRPINYGCFQSCYYPQSYGYHSYTPDYYYYEQSYDYEESGCDCYSEETSGGGDYTEIAYYPVGESNFLTLGASGELVALLQQALVDQGFDPGPVDGLFGYQTAEAVAQYQAAAGLLVDGIAGGQTLDSLGLAGAGA